MGVIGDCSAVKQSRSDDLGSLISIKEQRSFCRVKREWAYVDVHIRRKGVQN